MYLVLKRFKSMGWLFLPGFVILNPGTIKRLNSKLAERKIVHIPDDKSDLENIARTCVNRNEKLDYDELVETLTKYSSGVKPHKLAQPIIDLEPESNRQFKPDSIIKKQVVTKEKDQPSTKVSLGKDGDDD